MIGNEVKLLQVENERQSLELSEDDNQTIRDITKSMSIFKVNSYDAQVIRRDLIGMAQELKLRDSSLGEAIGDDLKSFTNDIIKSSSGPCRREILLSFLSKLSAYFCGWFILSAFGTYGGLKWDASPIMYFFYAGLVVIMFITEGILAPIYSTEKGDKRGLHTLISIVLAVIWGIIIKNLLKNNQYTKPVNGGYIILVSGIVFLITRYFIRRNIHKLAQGKKNYIADLK